MKSINYEALAPRENVDDTLLRQILAEEEGGTSARAVPVSARPTPPGGRPAPSLAMAYVPEQEFADLYDAEKGWQRGTVFARLDLPFTPEKCGTRR